MQPVVDFRSAREAFRNDMRASVLLAAARILVEDGARALTVRRVADEVNASTKVVYTLFGGKDGLLDALYLHSFARFGEALSAEKAVQRPRDRLFAMCRRYRAFALAEPALYQVMFGDPGRAYEAPQASRERAWTTFETLAETISEVSGRSDRQDVADDTRLLWAAMHGCVSLELRGLLKNDATADRVFERSCEAVIDSFGT